MSHFGLKERQNVEITVETFAHSASEPAYYLTAELIKVVESGNQQRIASFLTLWSGKSDGHDTTL